MLVLSRRENQKVLFPNLGITVEIVGIKGKKVRLGIDAPPEIRILRDELADEVDSEPSKVDALKAKHHRKNRLNPVALQLQIAQKLLVRGEQEQGMKTLEQALQRLSELEEDSAMECTSDEVEPQQPDPKWRALLVEDDDNERQLMATVLRMCGFEVDVVEDGQAAIDYLKTHAEPDCVLMDMQMPRLSGPETIAAIRDSLEFADIPIYGVSGLQRHEAKVPIGDRGVSGWFAKPVDADKMLNQIVKDFDTSTTKFENSIN